VCLAHSLRARSGLPDEQFSALLLRLGGVSPVVEPAELGRAFVGVDGLADCMDLPKSNYLHPSSRRNTVLRLAGRGENLPPGSLLPGKNR